MNTLLLITALLSSPDSVPYVTCTEGQLDTNLAHLSEPLYYNNSEDCKIVDYYAVADYEMYLDFGSSVSAVEAHITNITDLTNTDYQNAFNTQIQLNLIGITVSTSPSQDVWNDSVPGTILNQISQFRQWAQLGGIPVVHDLASLWTGRDLSGSVIGIAYVGTICRSAPYNVLENFSSNPTMLRQLMTHEIGHNFSAGHDAATGLIMSSNVSGSNTWSNQSILDINDYIDDNNACLSECNIYVEPDTCYGDVTIYDTTFVPVNIPVNQYDTNIIPVIISDTTYIEVEIEVYDTTILPVLIFDTTITEVPITVYDTNVVNITIFDTIITIVPITVFDTTITNVPVTIYDTTINDVVITIYDTTITHVPVNIYDTTNIPVLIYDTTFQQLTIVDTIIEYAYVTDTIIIDTVYVTDTICDFTTGFGTEINPADVLPQKRGTYNLLGQQIGAIRKSGYYIIDGRLFYVSF